MLKASVFVLLLPVFSARGNVEENRTRPCGPEDVEGITRVQVVLPKADDGQQQLPFHELVDLWLTRAGLAAVTSGQADAMLRIDARWRALCGSYGSSFGQSSYCTGAELSGAILFERTGVCRSEQKFLAASRMAASFSASSETSPERANFLDVLGLSGNPRSDSFVRALGQTFAGIFGAQRLLSRIVAETRSSAPEVRDGGARGLAFFEDPEAVRVLVSLSRDEAMVWRSSGSVKYGYWVSAQAASSLAVVGDSGLKALEGLLRTGGGTVCRSVADALRWERGDHGTSLLEACATDKRCACRSHGIDYLQYSEDPKVVPVLIQLLTDPAASVRRDAARTLGEMWEMGNQRALDGRDPIGRLLADSDAQVRTVAQDAMRKFGASPR